jgi:hypothetical protein
MNPYRDDDFEEPTTLRPRRWMIGASGLAWAVVFASVAWITYVLCVFLGADS